MHERFPCQLPFQICIDGGPAREGRLVNVGMGGACIRFRGPKGKRFAFEVKAGQQSLKLSGQVIWVAAIDPADRTWTFCGVQFTDDATIRSNLRLLVDYARSKKA